MAPEVERLTIKVSNVPSTAIASELFTFFDSKLDKGSVFACEIFTERKNWKSKGVGRVQFDTIDALNTTNLLFKQRNLVFQGTHLSISPSSEDIIFRPVDRRNRFGDGVLHVGFLAGEDCLNVLESWNCVKVDFMPERNRVEFWVVQGGETYKLEIRFGDVLVSFGCSLAEKEPNAILLKDMLLRRSFRDYDYSATTELKYAPKVYQRISGPTLASVFSADRYHICKENFEFLWVRTTDFSMLKSIGQSSSFCWELRKGSFSFDTFTSFPHYEGQLDFLTVEQQEQLANTSEMVPLITCPSVLKLQYEILFQLNALVHSQKLTLASVNGDLVEILSSLSLDSASMILQKLHKEKSTCYRPMSFVQSQLHSLKKDQKHLPSVSEHRLEDKNLMRCHRVLVTPLKVYCLGPEVETSNYVVREYGKHGNFLRVSFVEEDWSKIPSHAISTSIEEGLFSKPYRTSIYHRILSILRNGIEIGAKKFKFLAFSASQLRSNAVWMFASNGALDAQDIREQMGCFQKIRSVSKCAARMGQLFSSSLQTLRVPAQDVAPIPDVEITIDGINYCFSDGIGKISFNFAKQVALKCGLSWTPSAFQIRYGGYKGVVAVDRNSFRKLSLRPSMRKFDSKITVLNVTNWSELLPCYLNREIVTLLSTLGVEDEKFEAMQHQQIRLLDEMLDDRNAALEVLEGMGGGDVRNLLVKMLLQGYEPSQEPYLFMMLRAHRECQLSDIRSRCRIFVPKGRVLIGCLDETDTLCYGQVYIRVTMTRSILQSCDQTLFHKVDDTTSVVLGKVVVTKNPCLHPGDIRVLNAVYEPALEEKGFVDCIVFPQKGERPHPNECSGGDLDGDLFFASWDQNLIPVHTETPMDYIGRRPRIMDHDVTLEELQKFFVDYMINDNLGIISTAHLVHADREPEKARNPKCLQLSTLHSMAVDFAKTGAAAEMPRVLKPREYPDFLEREDRSSYPSPGIIGKLYRASKSPSGRENPSFIWSKEVAQDAYDKDLEVNGFEDFVEIAESNKQLYEEKMEFLMNYYGAKTEVEMLTGILEKRAAYLQHDKRKGGEMKDRILDSVKNLRKEAKGWFQSSCKEHEQTKMASAWYHVAYHPNYCRDGINLLSFPWVVGDILLNIKSVKCRKK